MRGLVAAIAAGGLGFVGGACGETPPPERTAAEPHPARLGVSQGEGERPDIEHLRALGYVDWDEDADPSLSGVTFHDRGRVAEGFNLYTNEVDEAYLCDLEGRRLHSWRIPRATQLECFALMPDGGIVAVSSHQLVARLDIDSKVLWFERVEAHHDVRLEPGGTLLVPFSRPGVPYRGRRLRFDGIHRFSADGHRLWTWFSADHHERLREIHGPSWLDEPPTEGSERKGLFDYYHLNTVEPLGDTELGRRDARFRAGNLLLCLRNVDTVAVFERDTMEPVWWWGEGELELPHMPTQLPNGNILIFDNGSWRKHSRVLELDPARNEIVWSYAADPPEDFFSQWRGSAQRLANGNTLICEAERGHAFEVTREGELVWEFWNPELEEGARKRIYRFLRVTAEELAPALRERIGA